MGFSLAKLFKKEDKLKLPSWATIRDGNPKKSSVIVDIDMHGAVTEWLENLGHPNPDQYWLEVCYQCAKLDVQKAIEGTKYDPQVAGKFAEFRYSDAPQWKLTSYPPGKGVALATKGQEARQHYISVRGALPFSG